MAFNVFSRQQWKLEQRGYTKEEARKIAYAQQKKNWNLIPWTFKLSEQWRQRSKMKPYQREIDRRAKQAGRNPNEYEYKDWKVRVKDFYRKK